MKQEKIISPETTAQDVLNFYSELDSKGIQIWIDGGWCVDALLGRQLRPHKDLDIAIQEKDVANMRKLLESKGYQEIKIEESRPYNFVLSDNNGKEIDVHVIVLDDAGNGIYGPPENNEMYPAEGLAGNGVIENQKVRCLTPQLMVEFIAPWISKWPEKYVPAVSALCEKYGIELPIEYTSFVQGNPRWRP